LFCVGKLFSRFNFQANDELNSINLIPEAGVCAVMYETFVTTF